jgi:hypothetical protein
MLDNGASIITRVGRATDASGHKYCQAVVERAMNEVYGDQSLELLGT